MNLRELERRFGRRLARLTTNAVVARPGLWRVFRWSTRAQFDRLAPSWDSLRRPEAFAAFELALEALPAAPKHVLDLGTGTGIAAFIAARRFPEAEVVGVDLAEGMLEQAREETPPELAGRVRFQQATPCGCPSRTGSFDLVLLANMIPFFDELARVVAPGRASSCRSPPARRRRSGCRRSGCAEELGAHGFTDFADFEAEGGTALLARMADRL